MNSTIKSSLPRYGMYALMGILGFTTTMVAPILNSILVEYQVPLSLGGMITGAMSIGGVLAIVVLGVFSDKLPKIRIVIAGYFVFASALLLICFAPSFAFLLPLFAMAGIGSKAVDALSNAVIKDVPSAHSGAYLNLMHMYLGIGAIAGPLVSGSLIAGDVHWKAIFAGLGVLCMLLCAAFVAMQRVQRTSPIPIDHAKADRVQASSVSFLKDRQTWIFCLVIFFYCGHQSCINTWISLYFQNQFSYNEGLSGLALAVYWMGIVISRLICARIYTAGNAHKLLVWGSVLGVFSLGCGLLFNIPLLLFASLLFCGIFTGGIIPVVIDMACGRHAARSGAITSLIYVCMNISTFIFPVMMGATSEAYGMRVGSSFSILTLTLMLVTILLSAGKRQRTHRQDLLQK